MALRDHSSEVRSKSNKQYQRRYTLSSENIDAIHDGQWTMDKGQVTITFHEQFVLRYAKNYVTQRISPSGQCLF